MKTTARGKEIPTEIGEKCKYGYELVAGVSENGISILRTPKGQLTVYENAWGKNEKSLFTSKEETLVNEKFETLSKEHADRVAKEAAEKPVEESKQETSEVKTPQEKKKQKKNKK